MHEGLAAESRRKVTKLERDRPLREAAARASERASGVRRRGRAPKGGSARKPNPSLNQNKNNSKMSASGNARVGRRLRQNNVALRALGPRPRTWTSQRAPECYWVLSKFFNKVAKPASLIFVDISWPTLCAPYILGPRRGEVLSHNARTHTHAGLSCLR
jgi:hypothetical protein